MAQIGDTSPSPDVRRVMGARVRETVADILRTYEQMFSATPQESCEWLTNQVEQVTSMRKGDKKT